ncbi:MAG: hypothetical protein PVSMB5_25490 [Ktedonobacteraceae bacterium]
MTIKQEKRDVLRDNFEADLPLLLSSTRSTRSAIGLNLPIQRHSFWNTLALWLKRNTFAPRFLPGSLQHPLAGYLVAILLQILAITIMTLLLAAFPAFRFPAALMLLVVLLVALGWGAVPSIAATLVGGLFLMFFLPPYSSLAVLRVEDQIGVCLYLAVGLTISVLASQAQYARYLAEALSTRFGDILDAIPEPVVIYDRHGKSVHLNQVAREGVASEQQDITLLDMPQVFNLRTVKGEPLPLESLPLTQALQGEIVHNVELSYTTLPDKHERFVSVSVAPLRSLSQKDIEGAITVTRDLSDLRCAQQQAAERAQQLEAIFEAMTDGIFILNKTNTTPQLNRAAWELLGLPQVPIPDLSGPLPFQLLKEDLSPLPYDDWPEKRIWEGERLQGETAVDVLMRVNDGRTLSLSVTGGPLYDAQGQVKGGVLVCRDVTERRSLERRVQQALDALLHMAQVIVQGLDAHEDRKDQRTITRAVAKQVAEQARQVLGCERLSLNGVEPETEILYPLAVVGLAPEEERAWWVSQEQNQGSLASSPDPSMTERLRRNEILILDYTQPPWNEVPNHFHLHNVLVAPIYLNAQLLGLLSLDYGRQEHTYTKDDIALTQAITQLIALVMERERLLMQRAEARATLVVARETNRMMDEFIGIAGHELRTPLTTVRASVQLARRQLKRALQSGQPTGEQLLLTTIDSLLDRAERQVRTQNRLVNDLLDVSRLHTDRLELHHDLCDLASLLEEVVEDQHILTPARTILLEHPGHDEVLVMADLDRLRQVITNYLSNALKYSEPEKEVVVRLEVQGTLARLSVQDEGPGLTEEQRQRIWERFYRVPGVEVKSGSGVELGLGLHISRMMIERQGGRVGVQSTPGKGSTFWFTLPLAEHSQVPNT